VYDPNWTPNTTDETHRRYRFGNQPSIALWNLARFAEALIPLFTTEEVGKTALETGLGLYRTTFQASYLQDSKAKLGLSFISDSEAIPLLENLDEALRTQEIDPTIFYRSLSFLDPQSKNFLSEALGILQSALYRKPDETSRSAVWEKWFADYHAFRLLDSRSLQEQRQAMDQVNPYFILRNYLVQEALDALAAGDRRVLDQLMRALLTPYEVNADTQPYFKKRPEWARTRVGCAALSCSS
jgi:uncharacterized protein YdiU (UPF0061 family)